ncbi:hypothetical protein AVEN_73884-1, partial [Araneus ventricosus]
MCGSSTIAIQNVDMPEPAYFICALLSAVFERLTSVHFLCSHLQRARPILAAIGILIYLPQSVCS